MSSYQRLFPLHRGAVEIRSILSGIEFEPYSYDSQHRVR